MASILPITKLSKKQVENGAAVLAFLAALYGIDESDLVKAKSVVLDLVGRLEKAEIKIKNLEEKLDDTIAISNKNNEEFDKRINEVIQNFKIRISHDNEINEELVTVNLDAR